MNYKKGKRRAKSLIPIKRRAQPLSNSFLDVMKDGQEFESLLHHSFSNIELTPEIRRSIAEVVEARNNYVVSYVSNIVKPKKTSVSIDTQDDLPFREMINSVPDTVNEIDFILVTPGGYASQVAKFVNTLRNRFERVNFILLNMAMSAGTIFCLSGDEIVMSPQSYIGPIDPQVRNRDNQFVPVQSILTLIEEIRLRGEEKIKNGLKPDWADLELIRNLDPKEIGNAISQSQYSIDLVIEYLYKYKFKTWINHSDGSVVTDKEKIKRAQEIAELLCDHSEWKIHGHAISRKAVWDVCKLKITNSETIADLDKAMRRMWALYYWIFENTEVTKVLISENYSFFRQDPKPK